MDRGEFVLWFLAVLITSIPIILGVAVIRANTESPPPCLEKSAVISIGGCDRYGECGVLTDKRKVYVKMPVVGEMVCVKWGEEK